MEVVLLRAAIVMTPLARTPGSEFFVQTGEREGFPQIRASTKKTCQLLTLSRPPASSTVKYWYEQREVSVRRQAGEELHIGVWDVCAHSAMHICFRTT